MIHIHHIDSLENPDLVPYLTLRRTVDHERQGIFVAEGEKVVARLMESDVEVTSVLITGEWLEIYRNRLESRSGRIEAFVGDKSLLSTIVGFHLHQGIMAVARIPKALELETIVKQSKRPILFVAVDGMTNSENLGVVVRNCVAFGVQALIVGETSSSPYLRRSVRNSMGTIFKLPVVQTLNLAETIHDLKERFSIEVIAAHPRAEQDTTSSSYFANDCCIVLGSEGYGISEKVLAACSQAAAIPMMSGVDSLNVSSASAVFLYEVMRQRKER
jgi:tRNA G18 (ribose-2'-O)-methylase SpoU